MSLTLLGWTLIVSSIAISALLMLPLPSARSTVLSRLRSSSSWFGQDLRGTAGTLIAPAAVFLQFGRQDKPITEKMARRYYELFPEPKRISFYDAGHELDAAARRDRAAWLRQRLSLKPIDNRALARIPQLK